MTWAARRRSASRLRGTEALFARKYRAVVDWPEPSNGGCWRRMWPPGGSQLATLAPQSASWREHHAVEARLPMSTTLMPSSADAVIPLLVAGAGDGGGVVVGGGGWRGWGRNRGLGATAAAMERSRRWGAEAIPPPGRSRPRARACARPPWRRRAAD